MFLIRHATQDDLKDLYVLARQTYFINLPPDKDIIAGKIEQSVASFRRLSAAARAAAQPAGVGSAGGAASGQVGGLRTPKPRTGVSGRAGSASGHRATTSLSDLFLLVVEQTDAGAGVVGTSQVIASMGGPGHPRVFLQLSRSILRSESLKRGIEHTVGMIGVDETGPTEVGGIIVNPAFRGAGLGRLLSLARFHLMGLFPDRFTPRVVAEMLGPIDDQGNNPFFEKFTRRFIPYSWEEIYRFSQLSREFVVGLMPPEPVYLSTMEPEVAACAGEVSDATVPARRMLEGMGFRYHDRIDPLDGGPHLEADAASLAPVRATRRLHAVVADQARAKAPGEGRGTLVSTLDANGEFRAVLTRSALVDGERVLVEPAVAEQLHAAEAVVVGAMEF